MKEHRTPKPSAATRKRMENETIVGMERRRAAAAHARSMQRTPTHSKQRKADNAEIAEYLSRVPPKLY